VGSIDESARVDEARTRALHRLHRQRATLRPLGVAAIVAVVVSAASGTPPPGLHGRGLGVTVALIVFAGTLLYSTRTEFPERSVRLQAAVIAVMGAAGVALAALQPHDATFVAGAAAVLIAVARLPLGLGASVAGATTLGLDLAAALSGNSYAVLAITLLCALVALIAWFLRQSRASQEQTEVLLAQLEDAREQQLRAAALHERSRIASELHDVLAHSLSGAAIQLQGARLLAERDSATAPVRAAIERAGELVRDGLANARIAVGTLRGEELPGLPQLEALVASFGADLQMDVALEVEGNPHPLPAEASLALYRGAQEALTNVARYAPGAATTVSLRYDGARTSLVVEDRVESSGGRVLEGVGGGHGLGGMRERVERVGGTMRAGPTATGWRVELEVPG
jgi:signal transduction histidine kinase